VHVVAATDKFRGTATAAEVGGAVAAAVEATGGECDVVRVADGGEGFLDAMGGGNRTTLVTGPLGDPVEAAWRISGGQAVVEMAQASGLGLVGDGDNDPVAASTYGTGELIGAAIDAGAKRVLVGVGGSATTDGGFGALRALYPLQRLRGIDIRVACDVRIGFVDAAEVFAPQKGATPAQVELLRRRLERLSEVYLEDYGVDVRDLKGSGAAGGLGGGLAAVGATLESGFDLVAEERDLFGHLEEADLVVTGEGSVDAESFDGKVVGGVLALAGEAGIPALVIAGEVFDQVEVVHLARESCPAGVTVVSLVERFGKDRAVSETLRCVNEVVAGHLKLTGRD
jgi:glycerate kinase